MGFVVAFFFLVELVEEALALVVGVVKLGEGVAYFEAPDVELEALDPVGFVGFDLGEGADGQGEVVDDRGLRQVRFSESLEESCDCLSGRSFKLWCRWDSRAWLVLCLVQSDA